MEGKNVEKRKVREREKGTGRGRVRGKKEGYEGEME